MHGLETRYVCFRSVSNEGSARKSTIFQHVCNRVPWALQSVAVSSPLCISELSILTRVEKAVKNTTIIVIYRVLVYIQISANYMFRPLLVRPSSGWIP